MLWRNTPAPRGGRRFPEGFIEPCKPTLTAKVPAGPDWIHELKYDGYRLICRKQGDQVKIWTRPGNERASEFTGIAAGLARIPHDFVIDGEGACIEGENCNFHALRSRAGKARATLMAFDLLALDGEDLRERPCEERRARLGEIVAAMPGIAFSEAVSGDDGQLLYEHACRAGLEGVVSKKRASRYRSGPSQVWRKTLCKEYSR
ncbi:hypothetical protein [Hyphomonas sp.]|uniref:ATP-dependent DNA ligase n=1 Tax=Hyphomonas sp. TaxID=87 RepID=UPI0025BC7BDF|nr:hypothetical protein [Hyphomonas sp.]